MVGCEITMVGYFANRKKTKTSKQLEEFNSINISTKADILIQLELLLLTDRNFDYDKIIFHRISFVWDIFVGKTLNSYW